MTASSSVAPARIGMRSERRLKHVDDGSGDGCAARHHYEELADTMKREAPTDARVDALMSIAATALPLESAHLLASAPSRIESRTWRMPATSAAANAEAGTQRQALPLTTGDVVPFGILQLVTTEALDADEVAFAHVLAVHVAVALTRELPGRDGAPSLPPSQSGERPATTEPATGDRESLYHAALADVRHRDDLLAIVAHDLKGPIGAILLHLRSLATRCDERQRRDVEAVRRAALRMLRQVSDLVDAASIETHDLSLDLADQPLEPIVVEQLDALRPVAAARRIALELETDDGLPTVTIDRERMHQVLANLVGNALKFTPPGGAIGVRLQRVDAGVRVSVADTGVGIAEANLPHVFDRFWHAPSTAKGGTGLGLHIVKALLVAHGVQITVASVPQQGTTFAFTIPATS